MAAIAATKTSAVGINDTGDGADNVDQLLADLDDDNDAGDRDGTAVGSVAGAREEEDMDKLFKDIDASVGGNKEAHVSKNVSSGTEEEEDFDVFLQNVMNEVGLSDPTGSGCIDVEDKNDDTHLDLSFTTNDSLDVAVLAKLEEKQSKNLFKEMRADLSLGKEFDWMFDDEEDDHSDSKHKNSVSAPDPLRVYPPMYNHAPPADMFENDVDNEIELITSLSAELQSGGDNKGAVLHLCRRLGFVHAKQRAAVWVNLLSLDSENEEGEVNPDLLSDFASPTTSPREAESTGKAASPMDQHLIISAMTDSAILRNVKLLENLVLIDQDDSEENQSWILREHVALRERLTVQLTATMNTIGMDANLCDPGLADIILVLCSPLVDVPVKQIPRLVLALQRARVLLLHLHWEDAEVAQVLDTRARLLENVLELHDAEMHEVLCNIAPAHVIIPWRWWRCAFAGEVAVSSLLVIWDLLIIDALPESHGDEGPSTLTPYTGVWEGCDPRGPLIVYVIAALLIRARKEVLAGPNLDGVDTNSAKSCASSPDHCLTVLRAVIACIPVNDARALCEEAKVLRASTPFSVVETVFQTASDKLQFKRKQEPHAGTTDATTSKLAAAASYWFGKKKSSTGTATKSRSASNASILAVPIVNQPDAVSGPQAVEQTTAKSEWFFGMANSVSKSIGGVSSPPSSSTGESSEKTSTNCGSIDTTTTEDEADQCKGEVVAQIKTKGDTSGGHVSRLGPFADRFKLMLGIGESSATRLKQEQQQEEQWRRQVREQVSEFIALTDLEQDELNEWGDSGAENDSNDEEEPEMTGDAATSPAAENGDPENASKLLAQTMLAISGLQRGSSFSVVHLRVLSQSDMWMLLPIYRGRRFKALSLLLVTNYRLIVLFAPCLQKLFAAYNKNSCSRVSSEEKPTASTNKLGKSSLPEFLSQTQLTVRHAWHLSQILQLVLYPRKAKAEKKSVEKGSNEGANANNQAQADDHKHPSKPKRTLSSKQKVKLSFRGTEGEYRFYMRHQDARTLFHLVETLAFQLYV